VRNVTWRTRCVVSTFTRPDTTAVAMLPMFNARTSRHCTRHIHSVKLKVVPLCIAGFLQHNHPSLTNCVALTLPVGIKYLRFNETRSFALKLRNQILIRTVFRVSFYSNGYKQRNNCRCAYSVLFCSVLCVCVFRRVISDRKRGWGTDCSNRTKNHQMQNAFRYCCSVYLHIKFDFIYSVPLVQSTEPFFKLL